MNGVFRRITSYQVMLAIWLLCFISLNPCYPAQATQQAPAERALAEQTAFQNALNGIADSVVRIEPSGLSTASLQGAREGTPTTGPSSGLVVGADGWILTTEFAVPSDIEEVVITLPPKKKTTENTKQSPKRLVGQVTGRDLNRHLVLLKCDPEEPLTEARFVPQENVRTGEWALAVGRVWDLYEPSIAIGIVSAVGRCWGRAIQTDAAISPVNYGGPLLNIEGKVFGIIAPLPAETAGMSTGTELYDSGVGFAIPMYDIIPLIPRLKKGEMLKPGLLGIGYSTTDPINGRPLVEIVRTGSPAAKSGLKSGDLITQINGQSIQRIADVRHVLTPKLAGDAVEIIVQRPEKKAPLSIRAVLTGKLPPWKRSMLGIAPVRQPSKSNVKSTEEGVVVRWTWPNSPAEKAGIQPQDVITSAAIVSQANEEDLPLRSITSSNELAGLLGGLTTSSDVVLKIRNSKTSRKVRVTTASFPEQPSNEVPEFDPNNTGTPPPAIVKLEIPEVAEPSWALIPEQQDGPPAGVLVFFDEPSGMLSEKAVTAWTSNWREAVAQYRVALVLVPSSDSGSWRQADLERVGKTIGALAQRCKIDPTRIAFAGSKAGGTFAWLGANRFDTIARGVCLIDADIPRRTRIREASPDRFRWVLFGTTTTENKENGNQPFQKTMKRLREAGLPVGEISLENEKERASKLCQWVEALGVL
ncbi:MAG: trypsin-like peptidase domain-containing protein [Pirellulales bacterium]